MAPRSEFSLRGTTKIGRHHSAILEEAKGGEILVNWQPGQSFPIRGHFGYFLIDVQPRQAKIRLPSGQSCAPRPEKGITCEGPSVAVLSLLRRQALPSKASTKDEAAPVNPFQALLERQQAAKPATADQAPADTKEEVAEKTDIREQLEQRRRERYQNFEPKRIEPDDVPPGMKIVRTPFGDRLVPE